MMELVAVKRLIYTAVKASIGDRKLSRADPTLAWPTYCPPWYSMC